MPRPDESTPNFDFLNDDGGAAGSSGVYGDSATNLLDPPATDPPATEPPARERPDAGEQPSAETLPEKPRKARAAKGGGKPRRSKSRRSEDPLGDTVEMTDLPDSAASAASSRPPVEPTADPTKSRPGPSRSKSGASRSGGRSRTRSDAPPPSRPNRKSGTFDWAGIREAGGQNLIIGLATYAGLATLAALFFMMASSQQSILESLPDVPPRDPGTIQYIAPTAELPDGHTLALGQSQQFGYIKVEPLRVVQAPVDYVHDSGEDRERMFGPDSVPLQLHLRLTNMSPADSDGQNIAPLDRELLYFRLAQGEYGSEIKTNQYIYNPGDRTRPAATLLELAPSGEWRVDGQNLPTLAPGESVETLIAADPPDELNGPLVWRVQFRKGYHLSSGHGVTTLIDVPFDSSQLDG